MYIYDICIYTVYIHMISLLSGSYYILVARLVFLLRPFGMIFQASLSYGDRELCAGKFRALIQAMILQPRLGLRASDRTKQDHAGSTFLVHIVS